MRTLAVTAALAAALIAAGPAVATASPAQPVAGTGSSSLDVLCSPIGGLLVAVGSAENPYGPLLTGVCLTR
ncbi:hypothetical protein [Nocardia thailandica]|uniref:hypothetical protein n=1 Tax=Nocardia thailandica TaxID=257275 RepID=UPI0002E8440C|nr:hypothetical protein [Nocardia thailandica]